MPICYALPQVKTVLESAGERITSSHVFVSICAGVPIATLEQVTLALVSRLRRPCLCPCLAPALLDNMSLVRPIKMSYPPATCPPPPLILLQLMLSQGLPAGSQVVRVMPNTPCLVGALAAGMAANKHTSPENRDLILRMLQSLGVAMEVKVRLESTTPVSHVRHKGVAVPGNGSINCLVRQTYNAVQHQVHETGKEEGGGREREGEGIGWGGRI